MLSPAERATAYRVWASAQPCKDRLKRGCLSATRAQIGAEVPPGSFKVGERVMALLSGGGYAAEVRWVPAWGRLPMLCMLHLHMRTLPAHKVCNDCGKLQARC